MDQEAPAEPAPKISNDALLGSKDRPAKPFRCTLKMAATIVLVLICGIVILMGLAGLLLIVAGDFMSHEFLYINDVHVNPKYEPYSDITNDPEGKCKRRYEGAVKPYRFGQYGCDPPNTTFLSAMSHVREAIKNPEFIIYGGDSVGHGLDLERDGIRHHFKWIIDSLHEQYPKSPILVTLGNNDFFPNYGAKTTDHLDFKSMGEVMRPYMNDLQYETFLKGGYYFYDIPNGKMRLLLLNTVLYNMFREIEDDPAGQFAWIRQVSEEAHAKGWSVGAAMHIFPGVAHYSLTQGWPDFYARKFDTLSKEVELQFTLVAHCHYDMIMPLYGDHGASMGYSLSSPAISPAHKNNPAFRVMRYRSGEITNIYQYYADIMMNPDELEWKLEYEFTDAYRVSDLSHDNLLKVIKWVSETSEGMWRYKEKVTTMASDYGKFYYCILKSTTVEQIKNCTQGLSSVKHISPYDDEI